MITINKALEDSMKLDFSAREMLIEILQKRQVEERRKEISANAKKAKTAFNAGKLNVVSASQAINSLNGLL